MENQVVKEVYEDLTKNLKGNFIEDAKFITKKINEEKNEEKINALWELYGYVEETCVKIKGDIAQTVNNATYAMYVAAAIRQDYTKAKDYLDYMVNLLENAKKFAKAKGGNLVFFNSEYERRIYENMGCINHKDGTYLMYVIDMEKVYPYIINICNAIEDTKYSEYMRRLNDIYPASSKLLLEYSKYLIENGKIAYAKTVLATTLSIAFTSDTFKEVNYLYMKIFIKQKMYKEAMAVYRISNIYGRLEEIEKLYYSIPYQYKTNQLTDKEIADLARKEGILLMASDLVVDTLEERINMYKLKNMKVPKILYLRLYELTKLNKYRV